MNTSVTARLIQTRSLSRLGLRQRLESWLPLLEGSLLVALGVQLLKSADLMVSGTAGISLLLNHASGWSFGLIFFVINLPFYALAIQRMGWAYSLRTFICITLLSVIAETLGLGLTLSEIHPLLAAPVAGLLIGLGLVILFRRQASLGGFNILAAWLEKQWGLHPGRTLLCTDMSVIALGLYLLPWHQVLWSLLAFVSLASVVGRYHRQSEVERHGR